jgi:hypothetical protein
MTGQASNPQFRDCGADVLVLELSAKPLAARCRASAGMERAFGVTPALAEQARKACAGAPVGPTFKCS